MHDPRDDPDPDGGRSLIAVTGVERFIWPHLGWDILSITATGVPAVSDLRFSVVDALGRRYYVSTPRPDGYVLPLESSAQHSGHMGLHHLRLVDGTTQLVHGAALAHAAHVHAATEREIVAVVLNGRPGAFELEQLKAILEPHGIPLRFRKRPSLVRWAVPSTRGR